MFSLNEGNRFVVCLQGVDLRKGLDSLCGLIRYLSLSPTNGDVYVFLNKSRTTMKLLHWERGGFAPSNRISSFNVGASQTSDGICNSVVMYYQDFLIQNTYNGKIYILSKDNYLI